MAQIDANATKEQIAQMEREFARKREAAARRRARELARLSEERIFYDDAGSKWTYVEVDASFARLIMCETEVERLVIPDAIEGLPVREVDPEALSGLESPYEVICARGICSIGAYAFRGCTQMRRLVLPEQTKAFSSTWVSKCSNLDELVLPGGLEVITADVTACESVRRLVIGKDTQKVKPGAFENSQLTSIAVDESNEYLKTDGVCLYTADGRELVTMACSVQSYDVASECRSIGEKAFVGAKQLRSVSIPIGVEDIAPFAFAHSGLVALECPPTLKTLGAKACLRCQSLQCVHLNEGLRSIGDEAFANSSLSSLHIPASVQSIGRSITARSHVVHAGSQATLSIDSKNPYYFIDEEAGLYHVEGDGLHLAQFLEPGARIYRLNTATIVVDDKAFAYHASLEEVELPEGLTRIDDGAFRVCKNLRRVLVPDSLVEIGAEAFIDTSIERFRIPKGLLQLGPRALVTDGAHHEGAAPALRKIDVEEGNSSFFMHAGMLCSVGNKGSSIVVFTNSVDAIDFPETTVEVEDYAFNNAFGITSLHLNSRLRTIGACGLSVMCSIRRVRIDVAEPIEGRTSFELHFPETARSVHGFLLALGGLGHLYLPDIMAQYDSCIASARDYHAPGNSDNASAYEQVKLIVERLSDSVLLTDDNRRRYHAVIADNLQEICVDVARHDDRVTLGVLADLGFLNADTIVDVTEAVGVLQDASITGYLLEMKRLRFADQSFDFDL